MGNKTEKTKKKKIKMFATGSWMISDRKKVSRNFFLSVTVNIFTKRSEKNKHFYCERNTPT